MPQARYIKQDHWAEPVGCGRAAVMQTRPGAKALRPLRRADRHGLVDIVHGHTARPVHSLGHTIWIQVDVHWFGDVRF
jgi:hypothetical protein